MWKKLLDKISGKAKKDGGSVEEKLKELKENAGDDDIVIALIGNKTDLEKDRLINKEIYSQG